MLMRCPRVGHGVKRRCFPLVQRASWYVCTRGGLATVISSMKCSKEAVKGKGGRLMMGCHPNRNSPPSPSAQSVGPKVPTASRPQGGFRGEMQRYGGISRPEGLCSPLLELPRAAGALGLLDLNGTCFQRMHSSCQEFLLSQSLMFMKLAPCARPVGWQECS